MSGTGGQYPLSVSGVKSSGRTSSKDALKLFGKMSWILEEKETSVH